MYSVHLYCVHKVFLHMALYGAEPDFSGSMGGAAVCPSIYEMRPFFQIPLTLTMQIGNNFQLNGASGETTKLWALQ